MIMNATFYVSSGTVGTNSSKYTSWSQLSTLATAVPAASVRVQVSHG
jgi:hypothetical protein